MYAVPPAITAERFVKIPDHLHIANRKSEWASVQFHGAPTPTFLEGPVFDRENNLWVTDIPWGRLLKISSTGEVTVECEYDGEPNGLKFHKDGRLFVADHKNGLMVFNPNKKTIEPIVKRVLLTPFKGTNDLVFASNGDLYFTDQGQTGLHDPSGRLYRLRTDGSLDVVLSGIPSPNGLVLNKSENIIFLAVTRANAIWRVPLMPDGTVSKVGTFIQMSGGSGPDGLAIDEEDNIAVCHVGLGTVWLFSSLGEPLLRIKAPEGILTTNCAYGGADRKKLFITESKTGTILTANMPVAGRALFSQSNL